MSTRIAFGSFVLDVQRGTLVREGRPVAVSSKGMRLLQSLLGSPGQVLTKMDLMRAAWSDVAVEESNLSVQIAALRKQLGPAPDGGEWIATIPRVGYRFVGGLSPQPAIDMDDATATDLTEDEHRPSIAVLPFTNLSDEREQEYFADGITDDIITALTRFRWFFVIARNSSFAYKGKSPDLRQVGRELGVRYVLEGSVRKAGNRVRITGQLIDTMTGAHIWADRFDGALDDIFELQDQVASNVVGAIEPKLRQSEIERATRKPTDSLDAYDLYLRAIAQFHKYTEEGMREAVALAKNALAIDPSYAPAAAMIGLCRVRQRMQGLGAVSEAEIAQAVLLARQAIEAGRDEPDALSMAGSTISFLAGEHSTAVSAIDRALALNPNSALAWSVRGWVLGWQNQPDSAIEAHQQAIRLSPLDPLAYSSTGGLAFAHMEAGRYEEAIEWADRTLHAQPRYIPAMRIKLVCLAYLGRTDDTNDWLKQVLAVQPELTIAAWKASFASTVFSPEILALYADGLRKAGVPEN